MNNLTPFGQLPIDARVAMFRAYQEGKDIQFFCDTDKQWLKGECLTWLPHIAYRIAPEPPSINWDHVAPKYVALAMDDDGECYLCTEIPGRKGRFWDAHDSADWGNPAPFASFKPGNCHWAESLVLRPQVTAMKIGDSVNRFRNHYQCPRCECVWEDAHDCTCDDRCPECNLACSPVRSEDL